MDKVFLIDGHAQIFRMYYAFLRRPMVNSKGEDTSILFGFTKMLLELIAKEQPTHLAVAFDPPAKTFRHEAYPEYKANRSAAPELVKAALEPLQEILAAFNIPVVMVPGYEADDAIGSMATQWKGENNQIYMVTPDKDYGQLIDTNVFQYKPAKGGNDIEIIGKEQICANYGICDPQQVIDILTIWGDSSDNVPGIKGIGEVGAKKLIGKFGSIEGILNNICQLPQKQQDTINESREQILMSRFLVTIKTDMVLPISLDQIQVKPLNYNAINEIFNKFEFNSLRKLLPQGNALANIPANTAQQGNTSTSEPLPVITESSVESVLDTAQAEGKISIRFTGSQAVILAANPHGKEVLNVCTIKSLKELEKENAPVFCRFKQIIEDVKILKIGYGFKHNIKVLKGAGIDLCSVEANGYLSNIGDIELMHYLINPERSHKEELLIKSYLNI